MTQTLSRDVPVVPKQTALLFVDVQNFCANRKGTEYGKLPAPEFEERVGFYFRRTIGGEHDNARLGILFMDQSNNLEAVGSLLHSQAQILNYHLVISFLNESLRFFNFARGIDLEAVVGKILSHRKTD